MVYKEIRCQVKCCPFGKKRCCFGEIDMEGKKEEVVERHKCKYAKGGFQTVKVRIKPKM